MRGNGNEGIRPMSPESTEKSKEQTAAGAWRLLEAEGRASTAYADALVEAGVLTSEERDKIRDGLKQIQTEYDDGKLDTSSSDVFAGLDKRLTEIVGASAGKLNAGRSRNEQAMTAVRLWLMDELEKLGESIAA